MGTVVGTRSAAGEALAEALARLPRPRPQPRQVPELASRAPRPGPVVGGMTAAAVLFDSICPIAPLLAGAGGSATARWLLPRPRTTPWWSA
jgi:hypothetical protein